MMHRLAIVTYVSTLQINWGLFVVELMKYCHYIMFGYNLLVNSHVDSQVSDCLFNAGSYCEPSDRDTPQVY